MADPITESALDTITEPIAHDDHILIGRDDQVYKEERNKVIHLAPRLLGIAIPQASDFSTWVNQDSAVLTDLDDGCSLTKAAASGSDSLSIRVRSLPSNVAFDVRLGCVRGFPFKNYHSGGMLLRESGTGKIETLGFDRSGAGWVSQAKWNSPTSFNDIRIGFDGGAHLIFFRAVLASGNITYYYSGDGVTWIQMNSATAVNNFFTTEPDQWGFFLNPNNQSGPNLPGRLDVIHWDE